ncbi:MAG: DinB family protein [Fimbriimonadaceae bacterium]|nr:MAG: DinB family protein [Fimbriimonadaceae bacterium]
MNNPYLIPGLRLGPLTVERLVSVIPAERWDTVTEEDRFTLREAIAHLADWEPIMRERIQTALSQPGTTIVAMDEGDRAVEMNYLESDPFEQAQWFVEEREKTIELIQSTLSGWQNTVIHPERGEMSAQDLANLLLGHDCYHIEHLTQFLTA